MGGSGRPANDSHLRRDETAPKMGHPVRLWLVEKGWMGPRHPRGWT